MLPIVYNGTMDIRIRDIPEDLHRKLKLICVMQGTSIQRQMIELIEEHVRKHEALLPRKGK